MLEFTFENVKLTEFGVGVKNHDGRVFWSVPVNVDVQATLLKMAKTTWNVMQKDSTAPRTYSPGEKHANVEYLFVPMNDDFGKELRTFYSATNIPTSIDFLNKSDQIFCYFARFVDRNDKRLMAMRRSVQFKGILKKKLIRFVDDSLKIVEDKIFKLDSDLDIIISSSGIHIWRPVAFEILAQLEQYILESVNDNIASIAENMQFLDIQNIHNYASDHLRAARYLASIRNQNLTGVTMKALVDLCHGTNVDIEVKNNRVTVPKDQIMGFLEVLDRRRYMRMMLCLGANILPRAWSILFSPSRTSVVPAPGTAFCHEIGGLEAPQPGQ